MTIENTTTLDTSGLNCPLPILKTKKAINILAAGDMLQVIATDPGSVKDISSFCQQTGHELVETSESGGKFNFLIRKH
jgi:tRNA 2-thiouridine synthesizing protein A